MKKHFVKVEMKTESTEFDQLEDFVNDVGIFHEVLERGRFERQIVRLEKNDISMSFRFYKNKYLNGQKIRILFPNLEH